jgi:hypothetical protein
MALTIWDALLTPIYALIIFAFANIKRKRHNNETIYKYYIPGLAAKLGGATMLVVIYTFYYGGGDTVNYFNSATTMVRLLFKDFGCFFDAYTNFTAETYSCFDHKTGYLAYAAGDLHSFFVVKLVTPIVLLSLNTFLPASLLLAYISYSGIWRLFLLFNNEFPFLHKKLAIAILYFPSVIFWGSGILKDTITLSAVGWFASGFYFLVVKKENLFFNTTALLLSSSIMIAIKPYIFFALMPGCMIWLTNIYGSKIKIKFIRKALTPFLIIMGVGLGYLLLTQLEDYLGMYKIDTVMERATIVQQDLKQDYYGGNTFDIGDFDGSIGSMLQKAPLALFAALFRPSILDVKNVVMLFSAIENTYLMILTIVLLMKFKVFKFFTLIWENPLVLFSFLFSMFFAFSVGISIANFGSLVRLKIPAIPFFVATLFILQHFYQQSKLGNLPIKKKFMKHYN